MAGVDPRRSSRARVAQSQSQVSSTSSSLSGRAERNSRHHKAGSPQKSTSAGSLSSESPEDTITAEDTLATRRRTRGQGEDRSAARNETIEMAGGDDDMPDEDEEAVRCICGYEDYPGPPPFDEDAKHGPKDPDIDPIFATDLTDDGAGLFVQCDVCKVWQHGACVGIMTAESSPDEYFCEDCRKDLHRIFTASNGQRYSHYLPLKRSSRAASRSASLNKDGTRSPPKDKEGRSGRASSANQTSKRRSTMNSRDAGYDEAEALRRAIEASKEDALPDAPDSGSRRAKRGRSDSEEKQENAKRQRTSSRSVSPSPGKNGDDSDDGATLARNGASKSKSRNGAPSRNQRAEKPSEKEERERQRLEAANKRKGRAERRRADDSDPSEELPLAARAAANRTVSATAPQHVTTVSSTIAITTATTTTAIVPESAQVTAPEPPPQSQAATDTPSPSIAPTRVEKRRSHKKKGRNQYTRDREGEDSPARSQSRDIQKDDHPLTGSHGKSGDGHKSHGKAKGGMNSKVTMTDMKRKAAAILDFISRTQLEMAGEVLSDTATGSPKVNGDGSTAPSEKNAEDSADAAAAAPAENGAAPPRQEKDFKELNCLEMMDNLTRKLVKWQQEYAA